MVGAMRQLRLEDHYSLVGAFAELAAELDRQYSFIMEHSYWFNRMGLEERWLAKVLLIGPMTP